MKLWVESIGSWKVRTYTYAASVDGEFYSENKEKQCND